MKAKRGKSGKDHSNNTPIGNQEPSTPIYLNQNSNSCSNDTNLSAVSTATSNLIQKQNPIFLNEAKIRTLLKELQVYVKNCQQERENNEPNLTNITKAHEKLKKEEKSLKNFKKRKLLIF